MRSYVAISPNVHVSDVSSCMRGRFATCAYVAKNFAASHLVILSSHLKSRSISYLVSHCWCNRGKTVVPKSGRAKVVEEMTPRTIPKTPKKDLYIM